MKIYIEENQNIITKNLEELEKIISSLEQELDDLLKERKKKLFTFKLDKQVLRIRNLLNKFKAESKTLTNKTITNPVITGLSALTVNGNVVITGTTNISGNTSFGGNIISGGTNLNLLFEPKVAKNKSFVLSNPAAGDKIPIFTVDKGTTITKVIRQTDSGSTTFNLIHGTNFFNGGTNVIGGTGTTATSAATTTTVFTGTPLIPSGSTLSYHSTGSTFTSSIIYLSIFYTD